MNVVAQTLSRIANSPVGQAVQNQAQRAGQWVADKSVQAGAAIGNAANRTGQWISEKAQGAATAATDLFKSGQGAQVAQAESAAGRVFWSGGRDVAGQAAMDWAKANGGKTLEMTTGGKLMETLGKFLPESVETKLWESLSRNFARGAEGTVNVFQNTAGVSLKSFWARIEYPALKNNVDLIFHNVTP